MSEGFGYLIRAANSGHVKSQHKLSVAYATGVFGAALVPMDASKAILLEYMSALGGSPEAAMGMGYRYLHGIGVPENCETAKTFYEFAANIAADQIRRRGTPVHSERMKISDVEVTSSAGRRDIDAEVVDYYKHLVSVGGDSTAAQALGGMYLLGSRYIEQDVEKAAYYLRIAADAGDVSASGQLGYLMAQQLTMRMSKIGTSHLWKYNKLDAVDGVSSQPTEDVITTIDEDQLKLNAEIKAIMKLLKYASNRGDANGAVGMGYVHFMGLTESVDAASNNRSGFASDIKDARNISQSYSTFFKVQAKHQDAGFYMGEILMGRGQVIERVPESAADLERRRVAKESGEVQLPVPDLQQTVIFKIDPAAAVRAYAVSSQRGNFLALHRLSHLAATGVGMIKSCPTAVTGFKAVAERGDWADSLTKAHRLFDAGDKNSALVLFSSLAAIGFESAQFNTAYLLMKATDLPWLDEQTSPTLVDDAPPVIDIKISGSETHVIIDSPIPTGLLANGKNTHVRKEQSWGQRSIAKVRPGLTPSTTTPNGVLHNSTWSFKSFGSKANCEARALALYAVSASQGSAESFLRVGDCFYYGCGGMSRDKVEAAFFYQLAADLRNTHAIFNLGLMHEAGDGVEQDFHLAKRFYDLAAKEDIDAKLPRAVALFLLSGHRSLQNYMGVPATDKMIASALEMIRSMESLYRRAMDHLAGLLPDDFDTQSKTRTGTTSATLHRHKYSFGSNLLAAKGFLTNLIASSEAQLAARSERKGLGDLVALLALSAAFLFIFRWKKSRRLRVEQRQHQ